MQTDKYNSLLHYTQPTAVTMTQQLHMIPAETSTTMPTLYWSTGLTEYSYN